jgi:lysozyme family protein
MATTVRLTDTLRDEYERLFKSCVVRPERATEVETITGRLQQQQTRYQQVSDATGVPWHVVAVIHNMESSLRFDRHLHNGDPLSARTVHVPAGRPRDGNPPFTWEVSASDAMTFDGLSGSTEWTLAGTLFALERFNGWGYRLHHPEVLSPYLWSASQHYTAGKYIADGTWSPTAKSAQCGAAMLLRRLSELGVIEFGDQPRPALEGPPILRFAAKRFSKRDSELTERAIDLQRWLNTFPGIFVKEDGIPGPRTSDAYRRVTGRFLPGDPRE